MLPLLQRARLINRAIGRSGDEQSVIRGTLYSTLITAAILLAALALALALALAIFVKDPTDDTAGMVSVQGIELKAQVFAANDVPQAKASAVDTPLAMTMASAPSTPTAAIREEVPAATSKKSEGNALDMTY